MKAIKIVALFFLFAPSVVLAGGINGTIIQNGQPADNVKVEFYTSDGKLIPSSTSYTDENGFYDSNVSQLGQVTMKVSFDKDGTAQTTVSSNNSPSEYNFQIVKSGNVWVLQKM